MADLPCGNVSAQEGFAPAVGLWTRGEKTTVTMHGRGDNPTPEEPGGTPYVADQVWLKFLSDTERAIRTSAPREPSARERAPGWPDATSTGSSNRWPRPENPASSQGDAVVGSAIATATAIALAAWPQLATSAGTPHDGPGDITLQQSEDVPHEVPAAPSFPAGNLSPRPTS